MLPKPSVDEIRGLAKTLEGYYGGLIAKQTVWLQYYNDEFETNVKKPYQEIRTGSAARIVDNIANHITTGNIQVTQKPRKDNAKAKESAARIARFLNQVCWIWKDSIDDAVHNAPLYGEAFFQPQYDPDNKDMPISLLAPNPMIIYSDPYEILGTPKRVIKLCKMTVGTVGALYPNWGPERDKESTAEVEYLAYWDDNWRYIEADKVPCIGNGVHSNILKFTPFVHFPSGFGKSSPEAKPEDRYVSILNRTLSKLKQECNVESQLHGAIAFWVNPVMVLKPTVEGAIPPQEGDVELSPGHTVTLGYGWDYDIRQGVPPPPEMFMHLARIKSDIGLEIPPVTMGVPSTSEASGRQEDIYAYQFRKKPSKVQSRAERALSTTLGFCLRILDTVPGVLPIDVQTLEFVEGKQVRKEEKITKEDIDGYYDVRVQFKAEEEMEQARKLMMFRALHDSPSGRKITWETLLTEGLGWSKERADEEIDNTRAELIIDNNPMLANILAEETLESMGLQRYIAEAKKTGMPLMPGGVNPMRPGQPRAFTGSPESRDVVRQMMAPEAGATVRKPPPSTGGG